MIGSVDMRVCAHKAYDYDNADLLYIMYVRLSYGKPFMTVLKLDLKIALVLNINIFTVSTYY